MNEQPSDNFTQPSDTRRPRNGGWIGGAILIALGILLLLQNLTNFYLQNWWALFILIPAVGSFNRAWRTYQDAGSRLTAQVRGSLFGGIILTFLTTIFLFNLNWAIVGPVILLLAGAGLLISAVLPD